MTTDEALEFLRSYQPLPPTREIGEDLLRRFDEVRKHFLAHPDNRCVPLLLNAFGEGDGHGVYQLVEHTILAHPEKEVIPALIEALNSPHPSVREWSAEIAANYPADELISPLLALLKTGSVDARIAAIIALERIDVPEVRAELKAALESDAPEEVKSFLREVLSE
ncbi:MAG: HEAT repeat domain-containing protein [Verrucomicrobiota bacterium]